MYQIDLRRQAFKDLKSIPADYKRLISEHIDSLEQNPRPTDSKATRVIHCALVRIVCCMTLTIKPNK